MSRFSVHSLPTTNTDNVAAKANQLANFPLNFLRTGYYNYSNGMVDERKTFSVWWSTTRKDATNANFLRANTTEVQPQYSNPRGYGRALRCVAPNYSWQKLRG